MNIYKIACSEKDPIDPFKNYPVIKVVTSESAQEAYDDFLVNYSAFNPIDIVKLEEVVL